MNFERTIKQALKKNDHELFDYVFEQIYNEYVNLTAYIISKYVKRKEDVEELVNDCYLNLYKNLFITKINNIKYYLVIQAKNSAVDFLKKRKINLEYNDEYIINLENKSENSLYDDIIKEMKTILSEDEINIIILYAVYNYSFKDLAIKYHIPLSSISSRYYRAIKKFNKQRSKL